MKKLIACFAALTLLLAGCGNEASVKEKDYTEEVKNALSSNYSFTADFAYEDITGTAAVEKTASDHLSASLTEPESMNGLVMRMQGDTVSLTYHDMAIDLSQFHLPTESMASLLQRVLSGQDDYTFTEENGVLTATADCTFFHYSITFNPDTMTPVTITVPELNASVNVRDFATLPAGNS